MLLCAASIAAVCVSVPPLFEELQRSVYSPPGSIFFPYASAVFCLLPVCFVSIPIFGYLWYRIFSLVPSMRKAFRYMDIEKSLGENSRPHDRYLFYKRKTRINIGIITAAVITGVIVLLLSFDYYLRADETGLWFNPFFSSGERLYPWRDLKECTVEAVTGKQRNGSPVLEAHFMVRFYGEDAIDLWNGPGWGSPGADSLMATMGYIVRHSNIDIAYRPLGKEQLDVLESYGDKTREDVLAVFGALETNDRVRTLTAERR